MNVQPKLQLTKKTYNREGMTDENSFVKALGTQPAQLSVVMTNLGAQLSNQFPVSFLTEGQKKIEYLDKNEYYYPVIDNVNSAIPIVRNLYQSTDKPGLGFSEFTLYFRDKFAKGYTIISSDHQYKARVQEEAREVAPGVWEHKCRIPSAVTADQFFPVHLLQVGKLFSQGYYTTSLSGSRGSESFSENPYQMQNQMSLIRKSYRYEGEVPKEVANFTFPTESGASNLWFDWEQWQYTQQWRQEQELLLWESEYNKDKNGRIHIKDKDSGKVVPNGSGIFEQIVNKDSYGKFSANKLRSVVRDAFFGTSGSEKKNITLFTGTGGREEFGNAMLEAHKGLGLVQVQKQASNGGMEMRDPSTYFDVYVTQEGHRVSVMTHPMFDNGPAALASDPHPVTGLPSFSYKMVFLDRSVYDGEDNIIMVAKKGLEFKRNVILGVGATPDGNDPVERSSDHHGSSVQFMAQKGIQIRRATNCFMLDFKQSAFI